MDLKKFLDPKGFRSLALATFYYTSGAIFGPLLVFGGAGYYLDQVSGTSPRYILIGLLVAFFSTNVLLYKKVSKLSQIMSSYGQVKKEKRPDETAIQPDAEEEDNK